MEENCCVMENGTRTSGVTVTNLDMSRSIRRSLLGGEDSTSLLTTSPLNGRGTTSPRLGVNSERCLSRSKTGTIFNKGTSCCTGTVLLSLVAIVVVSGSVFNDWNVLSFNCPFLPTSRDPNRGMGSLELVGESVNSQKQEKSDFKLNQNVDHGEMKYVEDDQCWSRSRHLFYRPHGRRLPPSQALRRSLLQYERLHARCTAGKAWKTAADLQSKDAEGECKFLIYIEGWEGIGNRLLSLVSAFAFSLATDRVLLIDSRAHLQYLLCEPFNLSSWKLPNEFPYDIIEKFPSLENVENYGNELGINLHLRHQQTERDRTFFCPETQERLKSVQWLAWNSNQYYVPRLFMIPSFWTRLNPLFPSPHHAFSQLVRYLCLPVNSVWAKTERTYQAYLSSSRKVVGLQIRYHSQYNFSHGVYDKVMNCLVGKEILPNVSRPNSVPPALTLQGKGKTDEALPSTSVFVATLHRDFYEALRDFYVDQGMADGSLVRVHTVSYDGAETFSYKSAVNAFIDIWLLSFSDTLVTSGWSTFGYLAQGLGAVRPYIMNFKAPSGPVCFSGQSIEPCNHYPFLSTCGATTNLTKLHESWITDHLRQCQDEFYGLQIV